jgi:hypothetical protein
MHKQEHGTSTCQVEKVHAVLLYVPDAIFTFLADTGKYQKEHCQAHEHPPATKQMHTPTLLVSFYRITFFIISLKSAAIVSHIKIWQRHR